MSTHHHNPAKENERIKHFSTIVLLLLFCAQWLIMALGPAIYYACQQAATIYATVSDVAHEDLMNKIYVSYSYEGYEYENVYYRSCESYQSPSKGGIVEVKITRSAPNHIIKPFQDLIFKPNKILEIIVVVVSAILCWMNLGTNFKFVKNIPFVDRDWVLNYAKRHMLLSMVLATSAILLNYIVDTNGAFYAVFTAGVYIIIRSVARWVKLATASQQVRISVATCLDAVSEQTGNDLDSSSLSHCIKTNLEDLCYYGYGRAAFFCANTKKNDRIVLVRFGKSAQPHMVLRLEKGTICDIKNEKQQKISRPLFVRLMPIAVVVLAWSLLPGLYQCSHVYNTQTLIKPSTSTKGSAEKMCAKCYALQSVDLPKLEDTVLIKVTEKKPHYSEKGTIEIDGITYETPFGEQLIGITFTLELLNTGSSSIKNVNGQVMIYSQNGRQLGTIQFHSADTLLPGETCIIQADERFVWSGITTDKEKLANSLAEAKLDTLRFDFSTYYE